MCEKLNRTRKEKETGSQLTLAKTSGAVTQDSEKKIPIADRRASPPVQIPEVFAKVNSTWFPFRF